MRAPQAFRDAGTRRRSSRREADVILSICPPHAALDVARAVGAFDGVYVDANAISPARAREIAALHPRFVDGGIVGGPPREPGTTPLSLGAGAAEVGGALRAARRSSRGVVADASALKMAYAAWSKGTAALLLAIRDVARHYGVEDDWRARSRPSSPSGSRAPSGRPRRRAGAGSARWRRSPTRSRRPAQPDGFHRAAAEVYRS